MNACRRLFHKIMNACRHAATTTTRNKHVFTKSDAVRIFNFTSNLLKKQNRKHFLCSTKTRWITLRSRTQCVLDIEIKTQEWLQTQTATPCTVALFSAEALVYKWLLSPWIGRISKRTNILGKSNVPVKRRINRYSEMIQYVMQENKILKQFT